MVYPKYEYLKCAEEDGVAVWDIFFCPDDDTHLWVGEMAFKHDAKAVVAFLNNRLGENTNG